jgi:hypothetical protein
MKHIKLFEDFTGIESPNGLTLSIIDPTKDEISFLLPFMGDRNTIMRMFETHGCFYVIQFDISENVLVGQIFKPGQRIDDEVIEKPELLFISQSTKATLDEIMDEEMCKEMLLDAVSTYGDKMDEFLEIVKEEYPGYYPGDQAIADAEIPNYSNMSKSQLRDLLNKALEDKDYEEADEISKILNPDDDADYDNFERTN